jgi:proteasome lid subunit RPN8/RPN11
MNSPLLLQIPESAIRSFRKTVVSAFPKEAYGLLLGYQYGIDKWECTRIISCPPEHCAATRWNVKPDSAWLRAQQEIAWNAGEEVIGDIHSHCYTEKDTAPPQGEPSAFDWEGVVQFRGYFKEYTFLCVMTAVERGGKVKTKAHIWPAGPGVVVEKI